MYVGPGDGGANRVFLDALRALVVHRTERATSRFADLNDMRRLQAKLDALGKHVPIIGVRPLGPGDDPTRLGQHARLDSGAPYYLELLQP